MLKLFDTLPFRAVRGAFMGLEDGMRGEIDTNEKFSDGYRENDPKKKSAAGQFLSDYSGIRGGAYVGEKIGQWGGGAACGVVAASWLSSFVSAGLAAGALAGAWPIFAAGVLVVGAAIAGGALLGVAGKYAGGFTGAIAGGIGGTLVGTYNAVFRRGYYAKGKKPEPVDMAPATTPEAAPAPQAPEAGQGTAQPQMQPQTQPQQPTVVGQNHPRVEAVLNNATPPASKQEAALAANARIPQTGFMAKLGQMAAIGGGSMLAAMGVKSAVNAAKERRNAKLGEAPALQPVAPRYLAQEAVPSYMAASDMSRAKRQVDAGLAQSGLRGAYGADKAGAQTVPQTAAPQQPVASAGQSRSFAQQVRERQSATAQQGTIGLN